MSKIFSLIMIAVGLACGIALATQPDGARYVVPMLFTVMVATLGRLTQLDS